MVMASKKEHGLKDVQRISNSGSKELGGGTTTIKFTLSLLSQRSIHSSSRRIDVMRFIRLLHRAIALLPILQILPNGLAAPLFMPPQPLVTASLANSPTASPPPVHLVVFQRRGASRLRRRLGVHLAIAALPTAATSGRPKTKGSSGTTRQEESRRGKSIIPPSTHVSQTRRAPRLRRDRFRSPGPAPLSA